MNQNTLRDFTKEIILENDIVLLRPLLNSDYERLLPFALQEQDIWTYSMVQPLGDNGIKNYIETALAARKNGTEYPFIIYENLIRRHDGSHPESIPGYTSFFIFEDDSFIICAYAHGRQIFPVFFEFCPVLRKEHSIFIRMIQMPHLSGRQKFTGIKLPTGR